MEFAQMQSDEALIYAVTSSPSSADVLSHEEMDTLSLWIQGCLNEHEIEKAKGLVKNKIQAKEYILENKLLEVSQSTAGPNAATTHMIMNHIINTESKKKGRWSSLIFWPNRTYVYAFATASILSIAIVIGYKPKTDNIIASNPVSAINQNHNTSDITAHIATISNRELLIIPADYDVSAEKIHANESVQDIVISMDILRGLFSSDAVKIQDAFTQISKSANNIFDLQSKISPDVYVDAVLVDPNDRIDTSIKEIRLFKLGGTKNKEIAADINYNGINGLLIALKPSFLAKKPDFNVLETK